jgi:hypothetical protein
MPWMNHGSYLDSVIVFFYFLNKSVSWHTRLFSMIFQVTFLASSLCPINILSISKYMLFWKCIHMFQVYIFSFFSPDWSFVVYCLKKTPNLYLKVSVKFTFACKFFLDLLYDMNCFLKWTLLLCILLAVPILSTWFAVAIFDKETVLGMFNSIRYPVTWIHVTEWELG